jgi:hypothetical protein
MWDAPGDIPSYTVIGYWRTLKVAYRKGTRYAVIRQRISLGAEDFNIYLKFGRLQIST